MSDETQSASQALTEPAQKSWVDGIQDQELRELAATKKFPTPESALKAYRELEKFMGVPKERLLKLPAAEDDNDGWAAVFARLGKPESPDGYDGLSDAKLKKAFHDANVPKKIALVLAEKLTAREKAAQEQKASEDAKKSAESMAALREEWGAKFDANFAAAKKASQAFGWSGDVLAEVEKQVGYASLMKFAHAVGEKLGEASFAHGSAETRMSREEAKKQINMLIQDKEFARRKSAGDAEAVKRWIGLQEIAYGQKTS